MTKISANIVADSINQQGDRLTSVLVTFPRIILAEVNTHRMLSKNTSSSRAIPFKKMVEVIQENPFIPLAWQKTHKGMQGNEYITDSVEINNCEILWQIAIDHAIEDASRLNSVNNVTKQLCNRLLEPFMWTTMLITGSKEGWQNFFELRCPQYEYYDMLTGNQQFFKSKKDWLQYYSNKPLPKAKHISKIPENDVEWLQINKGQSEIHMMALAESIYDVMNEFTPKQLQAGECHIPLIEDTDNSLSTDDKIKYSVGRAANTSYTLVGDGKRLTLEQAVKIHDKCKELNHSSVFEHCARAMNDKEYKSFIKGKSNANWDTDLVTDNTYEISAQFDNNVLGWCNNLKGFIPYRYILESENIT